MHLKETYILLVSLVLRPSMGGMFSSRANLSRSKEPNQGFIAIPVNAKADEKDLRRKIREFQRDEIC